MTTEEARSPADESRWLMRSCDRAVLATRLKDSDGEPYASLVMVAARHDASPILLISRLAEHTQNLLADERMSLLFDGTAGFADALTGPRVSLQGRARPSDDPELRARFLARHPGAAMYADFADFSFYEVDVERAHLVAGFGRIDWVAASEVLYDTSAARALAGHESSIIDHMNSDHADAVALYARVLLGKPDGKWVMTGIDPEGADLACNGAIARLPFDKPVTDGDAARDVLVSLAAQARQNATS